MYKCFFFKYCIAYFSLGKANTESSHREEISAIAYVILSGLLIVCSDKKSFKKSIAIFSVF